jgi:uracil-DNA glycosylase
MDKIKSLEKLNREVKVCKKCPLYVGGKNSVPGEGPLNAKIMFIGEAPGKQESITGRPFVGRSGKLLTKLMESAGIKREKVFITSVIKHRPPDNRKPTAKEIAACLPYLQKQIEIINPQKIVLLGQTAFSAFFAAPKLRGSEGGFSMKFKDMRGKFITPRLAQGDKKSAHSFFITYHPAAGLRFVKMKKILERDFQKLRGF